MADLPDAGSGVDATIIESGPPTGKCGTRTDAERRRTGGGPAGH
jgi:hypothetical protein